MFEIEQILEKVGANTNPSTKTLTKEWSYFVTSNQTLYKKALHAKGNGSELGCLLGVTTKTHIASVQFISESLRSRQAMKEVLANSVGEKYATKFEQSDTRQLLFDTHLWLYLQGYCQLDFSLANEYALRTAQLMSQLDNMEIDQHRCQLLKSFYLGKERAPKRHSHIDKFIHNLKNIFSNKSS